MALPHSYGDKARSSQAPGSTKLKRTNGRSPYSVTCHAWSSAPLVKQWPVLGRTVIEQRRRRCDEEGLRPRQQRLASNALSFFLRLVELILDCIERLVAAHRREYAQ